MGRNKNKKKGNTRPSSSMHSAELLSSSGGAPPPGLIGFQNCPVETTALNVPTGNQEEDSSGNMRVIQKMMLKKDVVTKLKGIQEFSTFCASDNENALRFLPSFPRIYNKLALETNIRVREAIQRALDMYIPKLKKDMLPYLKSFMPTWLITQCDPDTPAALAAQSAFLKSFPEHKQSGAVMYCRSEILKAIKDNLCELTEGSLSESGSLTEDVCKEKYELIVICSVRGLKLFVSLLSEKDKPKVIQPISDIVCEKQFWDYSQSQIMKVRAAWYELFCILTSRMPEVLQEKKNDLISLVISSLWKGDSQVIGAIWNCALQLTSTFEDWWHQIKVSNMLLSPLLEFLSCGGYGNAAAVYGVLPDFFISLVKTVDEIEPSFYMEFFSCIRKSFLLCKLKTSPKECDAVTKGFVECLKHLTKMYVEDFDSVTDFTNLISKQLIPLIQSSLRPDGCHIAASSFYAVLGLYLQDLEVHMGRSQNESHYCNILTSIWENISLEIIEYLSAELEKPEKDVSVLVLLFHCLHQPQKYLSANERKVHFCGESSSTSIDTSYFIIGSSPNLIAKIRSSKFCDSSILFKYTVRFCGHLCLELQKSLKPCYLELCAEIMSETSCHQLFCELLEVLHVPVNSTVGAPLVFFKAVVLDWIKRASSCCDEVSLDWIRDIIICICFSVHMESAAMVLEMCSVMEHQKIFQRLIMRILGSKESHEEIFHLWFHSHVFCTVFEFMAVTFARKLINVKLNLDSPETALCSTSLMLCFAKAGSEPPEIPWKPVKRILNYFTHILSVECCVDCENQGDYNIIDFICDSAEKLLFQYPFLYLNRPEVTKFLFKIFTLSLEWAKFNVAECSKEQQQLDYLWKTSVAHVVLEESDLNENNFLLMASGHLHDLLLKEMSKEKKKRVIEMACLLLENVEEAYCDMTLDTCESVLIFLIKKIFPSSEEWEDARSGLKLGTVVPVLQGNWFYPYVPDENLPISHVKVPPLLFVADAVAELLTKIIVLVADKCKLETHEAFNKLLCSQYLPYVLWSLCYADSLNFCKPQDAEEPPVFVTLRKSFMHLTEKCNISQLVKDICSLLIRDDLTWGIPFETVMRIAILEQKAHVDDINTFYLVFDKCKRNYLTLTQICLKYSSKEFIVKFLNSLHEDALYPICNSAESEKEFLGTLSQLARSVQPHNLRSIAPRLRKKVCAILEHLVNEERFFKKDHRKDVLFVTGFSTIAVCVMKKAPNQMSGDLLFLLIETIRDWFERCVETGSLALTNSPFLVFVQQTCKLMSTMSDMIQEWDKDPDTNYNKLATEEWKTVFGTDISKELVKLFLQFAGKISELNQTSNAVDSLLFSVVQTLEFLTPEQIFEAVLFVHSQHPSNLDLSERIDSAYKVLDELTKYLNSKSICVQFGIHLLLKKALVHLPKIDERQKAYEEDESVNAFRSSPLVKLLTHTNEVVTVLLDGIKSTECLVLKPFTEPYTYAMTNLLAWHIFLEYASASITEDRSVYVGCLADSEMLSCMLLNVLRLRPENPSACSGHIPRKAVDDDDEHKVDLHEIPPMCSLGTPSSKHLQHVACTVYVAALKQVPALVRTWWSNLDKKTAAIVEKFTSENISKILLLNEISGIEELEDQFDNMAVEAHAVSRQVIATYTLDDATIELSIQIPPNFPLGPVVASSNKRTIVDQNLWRTWMFQLTTFLNFHNGSVKDALLLWKKNLDKRFEGVEECMVCYFVLHGSSGTLPNKTCRVCKKKFHGSCLFKWFKMSNSCSCPGCRNDF